MVLHPTRYHNNTPVPCESQDSCQGFRLESSRMRQAPPLDVAVVSPPARSVPDACHWHAEPSEGISCEHGRLLPRCYAHKMKGPCRRLPAGACKISNMDNMWFFIPLRCSYRRDSADDQRNLWDLLVKGWDLKRLLCCQDLLLPFPPNPDRPHLRYRLKKLR
jgi:hypothetical protein